MKTAEQIASTQVASCTSYVALDRTNSSKVLPAHLRAIASKFIHFAGVSPENWYSKQHVFVCGASYLPKCLV